MARNITKSRRKVLPETVRQNIQLGTCLAIIEKVDQKLMREHERMDLATVPALRLLCENQWRKINKVLPDLKAIDHSGSIAVDATIRISVG